MSEFGVWILSAVTAYTTASKCYRYIQTHIDEMIAKFSNI